MARPEAPDTIYSALETLVHRWAAHHPPEFGRNGSSGFNRKISHPSKDTLVCTEPIRNLISMRAPHRKIVCSFENRPLDGTKRHLAVEFRHRHRPRPCPKSPWCPGTTFLVKEARIPGVVGACRVLAIAVTEMTWGLSPRWRVSG